MKANRRDPDLYSPELEWWVCFRDADCGHRSNFAGFLATLERGGAAGVTSTDPYHDGQVGLGLRSGAFDRDRRIARVWARLSPLHGNIITAQYHPNRFPLGTDARFAPLTGVVLYVAQLNGDLGRLLDACQHQPGGRLVVQARAAGEKAARGAHRAYYTLAKREAEAWAAWMTLPLQQNWRETLPEKGST